MADGNDEKMDVFENSSFLDTSGATHQYEVCGGPISNREKAFLLRRGLALENSHGELYGEPSTLLDFEDDEEYRQSADKTNDGNKSNLLDIGNGNDGNGTEDEANGSLGVLGHEVESEIASGGQMEIEVQQDGKNNSKILVGNDNASTSVTNEIGGADFRAETGEEENMFDSISTLEDDLDFEEKEHNLSKVSSDFDLVVAPSTKSPNDNINAGNKSKLDLEPATNPDIGKDIERPSSAEESLYKTAETDGQTLVDAQQDADDIMNEKESTPLKTSEDFVLSTNAVQVEGFNLDELKKVMGIIEAEAGSSNAAAAFGDTTHEFEKLEEAIGAVGNDETFSNLVRDFFVEEEACTPISAIREQNISTDFEVSEASVNKTPSRSIVPGNGLYEAIGTSGEGDGTPISAVRDQNVSAEFEVSATSSSGAEFDDTITRTEKILAMAEHQEMMATTSKDEGSTPNVRKSRGTPRKLKTPAVPSPKATPVNARATKEQDPPHNLRSATKAVRTPAVNEIQKRTPARTPQQSATKKTPLMKQTPAPITPASSIKTGGTGKATPLRGIGQTPSRAGMPVARNATPKTGPKKPTPGGTPSGRQGKNESPALIQLGQTPEVGVVANAESPALIQLGRTPVGPTTLGEPSAAAPPADNDSSPALIFFDQTPAAGTRANLKKASPAVRVTTPVASGKKGTPSPFEKPNMARPLFKAQYFPSPSPQTNTKKVAGNELMNSPTGSRFCNVPNSTPIRSGYHPVTMQSTISSPVSTIAPSPAPEAKVLPKFKQIPSSIPNRFGPKDSPIPSPLWKKKANKGAVYSPVADYIYSTPPPPRIQRVVQTAEKKAPMKFGGTGAAANAQSLPRKSGIPRFTAISSLNNTRVLKESSQNQQVIKEVPLSDELLAQCKPVRELKEVRYQSSDKIREQFHKAPTEAPLGFCIGQRHLGTRDENNATIVQDELVNKAFVPDRVKQYHV